jgi:dUTP pyrophosphatase
MEILFKKLHPDAKIPARATNQSAGMDLIAIEPGVIEPGKRQLVKTGLSMQFSEPWWEAQIRPRSGLAFKFGITVLNAPGTIDSDYRGEIGVLLINHGDKPWAYAAGDRIAQMVIAQVNLSQPHEIGSLSETDRGEGGFGSTGLTSKS